MARKPDFVDALPPGEGECPLFVTWDKKRHAHHPRFELRGCIGTHSPKPLATSIGEYAKISALKDKRFHPIGLAELPLLRVAVSLLIRYEPCEHCHDWTVGVHGIIIGWVDDAVARGGEEYSATYLPEVAADQGWDQGTAVESLIRKAGYHGRITPAFLKSLQCTRYQTSKVRATFDEYLESRGAAAGDGETPGAPSTASALVSADGSRRQQNGRARDPSSNYGCVIS